MNAVVALDLFRSDSRYNIKYCLFKAIQIMEIFTELNKIIFMNKLPLESLVMLKYRNFRSISCKFLHEVYGGATYTWVQLIYGSYTWIQ